MLKFPDDTQVQVNGLNEILAKLYSEGRTANQETVDEIIDRLAEAGNHIPPSDHIRKEYRYVLLKEYREYLEARWAEDPPKSGPARK
jgi:hypothetical protein